MKKVLILAMLPVMVFSTTAFSLGDKEGCSKNKRSHHMLKKMYKLSDERKADIFKAIDTDKNGKISEKELQSAQKRMRFIMRDTNGDGELSQREFFTFKKLK